MANEKFNFGPNGLRGDGKDLRRKSKLSENDSRGQHSRLIIRAIARLLRKLFESMDKGKVKKD